MLLWWVFGLPLFGSVWHKTCILLITAPICQCEAFYSRRVRLCLCVCMQQTRNCFCSNVIFDQRAFFPGILSIHLKMCNAFLITLIAAPVKVACRLCDDILRFFDTFLSSNNLFFAWIWRDVYSWRNWQSLKICLNLSMIFLTLESFFSQKFFGDR